MTWQQMADAIAKMTPEDRVKPVRFVEPYDDDREGWFPQLVFATEPVLVGPRGEEKVFVERAEPYLQ